MWAWLSKSCFPDIHFGCLGLFICDLYPHIHTSMRKQFGRSFCRFRPPGSINGCRWSEFVAWTWMLPCSSEDKHKYIACTHNVFWYYVMYFYLLFWFVNSKRRKKKKKKRTRVLACMKTSRRLNLEMEKGRWWILTGTDDGLECCLRCFSWCCQFLVVLVPRI